MKKKIFLSILFSSVLSMLLSAAFVTSVYYISARDEMRSRVRAETNAIKCAADHIYNDNGGYSDYLAKVGKTERNRLTLISPEGEVLYDSYGKTEEMENHLLRPEVAGALENGEGSDSRLSDTLGENSYYYAVKLEDGNILRLSYSSKNVLGIFGSALVWILVILVFVLIVAAVTAYFLTERLIRPLNRLNLDVPLSNDVYEELSPLLTRMQKQNERINQQLTRLEERRKELDLITGNMREGLVIFGGNGAVLSANRAAARIFGEENAAHYPELCRDMGYIRAVEGALKGVPSSARLEKGENIYELTVTPVEENLGGYAAVLFAIDVTQRESSEKMRREFSANVSHELKTPLTSIMGYAEIIQEGVAAPADVPNFAGRIRKEASGLLTLIEDIISLSRLDEGELEQKFDTVDLNVICGETVEDLKEMAEKSDITLDYEGEETETHGVPHILRQMAYNLIVNAISYNNKGGNVWVNLKDGTLTVRDDGIGIPKEEQRRVFERFYRVDKSRSKETGGTGLGLSIVKHGAALHGAEINIESEVGKGTEIKIKFAGKS